MAGHQNHPGPGAAAASRGRPDQRLIRSRCPQGSRMTPDTTRSVDARSRPVRRTPGTADSGRPGAPTAGAARVIVKFRRIRGEVAERDDLVDIVPPTTARPARPPRVTATDLRGFHRFDRERGAAAPLSGSACSRRAGLILPRPARKPPGHRVPRTPRDVRCLPRLAPRALVISGTPGRSDGTGWRRHRVRSLAGRPARSFNERLTNARAGRARRTAVSDSSVHFAVHFPLGFIYRAHYV